MAPVAAPAAFVVVASSEASAGSVVVAFGDGLGAAAFVVLDLGARTFEVAVMKEQLQPPNNLLFAAAKQCGDLMRTQKTMSVDEPDNVVVAAGQLDGCDRGNAAKTG